MKKLLIGDIFAVSLDRDCTRYFQFVAIDESQLRSDVVRVFSGNHSEFDSDNLVDLVRSEVEFYAHCVIKSGVRMKSWSKVGHASEIGPQDIQFRSTLDFGRNWIEISDRWEIWKISRPRQFVGKLSPELRLTAEHGEVFPPYEIIHRMKFGRYQQDFHG